MSEPAHPGRPGANAEAENPAPETLEGWYVLHDIYDIDWAAWRQLDAATRAELASQLIDLIAKGQALKAREQGDSAAYRVASQKGDLMLVHYRDSIDTLTQVERELRGLPVYDLLIPRYGYLSVVEASLYEATGRAHAVLAQQGLTPSKEGFGPAFAAELENQKQALHDRVFRAIPPKSHVCFYPMSKRRGEQVNWYDTPLDERRKLMRGHGRIGHKYFNNITQVISGSVAFDDWEWAVDLHGDDPLQFKKLVYEMRFDPASSRYAEFGPFYIGILADADSLRSFFA